jgi:hypothetical protein
VAKEELQHIAMPHNNFSFICEGEAVDGSDLGLKTSHASIITTSSSIRIALLCSGTLAWESSEMSIQPLLTDFGLDLNPKAKA